ncbi:hypothetical protein GA0111570_11370 [Raineyella antarctica]|uniref:PPi-type phosphoenolpyruvate carboxykinase lobe 2 domain-containing protein n=1 Tax=Raineyella antarctica TaxID=1577474 RepID=A0A1G6HZ57_9ACTN|nr:hypothetical protein [Raineyella antarctica]SDB99501.1 hypothetical protein GA0111570_11370 [Raineyella antarctica]
MATSDVQAAITVRLALLGLPVAEDSAGGAEARLVAPLLARQRELGRRLADRLCPVDARIQAFLDEYLADTAARPALPPTTLVLDQPGLARGLSLPMDGDSFSSAYVSSYRLLNGVLHNPTSDRRTTAGVFHIAEGGLPIPDDKIAVPKDVFGRLLELALQPPQEALELPWSARWDAPARSFASLLLRPVVVPAVPGVSAERTMEVRFIVPGGLVSNLDFVEGIFGNAGDPQLPENDAALDAEHWTGTTGCVILAPHLVTFTKRELGLPHRDQATERQRRDGQCWQDEGELYNGGKAFKVCARTAAGVIVTVIADNYFGYCKKEVKTQIGYSANLFGGAEEEHSGGALVFPSYNEGQEFYDKYGGDDWTLADVLAQEGCRFVRQSEGHALDPSDPGLVMVPGRSVFSLRERTVAWDDGHGGRCSIPLRADRRYLTPDGYRIRMSQSETDRTQWTLTGTAPRSTSCHKPSTVSGGGKSEISKAITDAFVYGSAYVKDFDADIETVTAILARDFANRFADPARNGLDHRPVLSDRRSMGSVIKLLTPSADYTWEYNEWLRSVPQHIKELVFVVKRSYRPEWGADWRSHFTVGIMNGRSGNALRLDGERVIVSMLRVGFDEEGAWRLFSLRPDFSPATKVQTEDDITASTVVPARLLGLPGELSRKVVANCERLLFQRPDDAIHRGYDKQAERDISGSETFLSNFQPLDHDDARAMRDDAMAFSQFSEPIQDLVRRAADLPEGTSPAYFVSSANPRLVDGKPSRNPRYLQVRPDLADPEATALADLAMHLHRRVPMTRPAPVSVDVVAAGRRNNPPEPGVPPLCAFNPLHYLELPELFMEFISSMTGKSPSTTGAGSEGALTKGPFNALPAVYDLNAALLSYVLTGYDGWVSCAGYVGPQVRVDHDISLLVPEVFSRMSPEERDASALVAGGYLERVEDMEVDGRTVLAGRLGYRMTQRFATAYFGRIFMHPDVVFTEEMLRPELQDPAVFAESIDTIVTTHQRVARAYFEDGTADAACPPLRALLEVMAFGATADGRTLDDPGVRELFTRENVLASDWYARRLDAQQAARVRLVRSAVERLDRFAEGTGADDVRERLHVDDRLDRARRELAEVSTPEYRAGLVGQLGLQPELA